MQKITIKEIKIGKPGKPTIIIAEDDSRFSGFDTKLASLNVGAVIEVETEIKKGFVNISKWQLVSELSDAHRDMATPSLGTHSRGKSPEEIASEETMCRAKIIAELWFRGKYLDIDPKVTWLNQWLIRPVPGSGVGNSLPKAAIATEKPLPGIETAVSRNPDHVAGFDRDFLTHSMKTLKWDIAGFIKEYALKFGVKSPPDKLPEFLSSLSQPQREELSRDLQARVDKVEVKA